MSNNNSKGFKNNGKDAKAEGKSDNQYNKAPYSKFNKNAAGMPILTYSGGAKFQEWVNEIQPMLAARYGRISNMLTTIAPIQPDPVKTYKGKELTPGEAGIFGMSEAMRSNYNLMIISGDYFNRPIPTNESAADAKKRLDERTAERKELKKNSIMSDLPTDAAVIAQLPTLKAAAQNFADIDAESVKSVTKQIRKIREAETLCFGAIMEALSLESKDVVLKECNDQNDYDAMIMEANMVKLVRLLHDTHRSLHSGNESLDRRNLSRQFYNLRQGAAEHVSVYHRRILDALQALADAGLNVPDDDIQAASFLNGLNGSHIAINHQINESVAIKTGNYPDTLAEAYERVRIFLAQRTTTSNSKGYHEAAYATGTNEDSNLKSKKGKDKKPNANPQGGNNSTNGAKKKQNDQESKTDAKNQKQKRHCLICKTDEHWTNMCSEFAEYVAGAQNKKATRNNTVLTAVSTRFQDFEDDDDEDNDYDTGYTATTEELILLAKRKRIVRSSDIILDNGATVNVFNDENLLTDTREVQDTLNINGVSGQVKCNTIGYSKNFGHGYLVPSSPVNLVSQGCIEENGYEVKYQTKGDYYVTNPTSKEVYTFVRTPVGKSVLWIYDPKLKMALVQVATQAANAARFTKLEVKQAQVARDLMKRMGYISANDLIFQINHGMLLNCPVSPKDIIRSQIIFGKSLGDLKGKTVDIKSKEYEPIEIPRSIQSDLELNADIMFIDGMPFLISVTAPLGLTMTTYLKSQDERLKKVKNVPKGRDTINLWTELLTMIRTYELRNFKITTVHSDGENGIVKNRPNLEALGINFNPKGPGKHVPVVERKIRQIKERVRGILSTLPYRLPKLLIPWLVKFATYAVNCGKSNTRMDAISPRESFNGIKIDILRDFRIPFGAYAQVYIPNQEKNSMAPRTEGAIALMPKSNRAGSVIFMLIASNRIVIRDQFKELPMSDELIEIMNAKANDHTMELQFGIGTSNKIVDEEEIQLEEDLTKKVQLPNFKLLKEDVPPDIQLEEEDTFDIEKVISEDKNAISTVPVEGEDMHTIETNEVLVTTEKVLTREEFREKAPHLDINRFSYKQGIKIFGHLVSEATAAEFRQLLKMGVIEIMKWTDVSKEAIVIYCIMFLKAKYKTDGTFDKIKARLAAGGNMIELDDSDEVSSPTLDSISFNIMVVRAAELERFIATADVPYAYLWASRKGKKIIFMRISKELAILLLEINPEYKAFLNNKGELIVKLNQALYGLPDSGELWYETLSEFALSIGFEKHPLDRCVFMHKTRDLDMSVYVDDLFITAKDENDIKWLSNELNKRFTEMKVNIGQDQEYLGMKFKIKDGIVEMSMPKHINDILDVNNIKKVSKLPHTVDLFTIDAESPLLNSEEKDGFRSIIASLLYVAKRVRPDILLPVQFLSTRVSKSTLQDKSKLIKVLQYLNGTRDMVLRVCATKDLQVKAFIDASYGCHDNGKGQTGAIISLGQGPIFVKSTKQKIATKSSTEAEIIGVSDVFSQIIWVRDFIKHLCGHEQPALVYQDNTSALTIIERGIADGPTTKHINVRYHFIKDRIDIGELTFKHLSTNDMLADIFTKPLSFVQFSYLRDRLMNGPSYTIN